MKNKIIDILVLIFAALGELLAKISKLNKVLVGVLLLAIVCGLLSSGQVGALQYRTMLLTGGGMWSATTAGSATNTKIERPTNDVDFYVLDFDASTDESAQCTVAMPEGYLSNTPVYATVYWTTSSSDTSHTVYWDIVAQSYGDDDTLDGSWGTKVTVNDNVTAAYDMQKSAESTALTIANTPARGDLVQFKITRDADNGSDDLTTDARLLMVKIRFAGN